ncbi:restriction endonuclease subunit S [Thermomonas flagellata]|uniref:restriction endonuclease subunit S n=1 Tax=Thermomonas flagellata TaxID=2888524 RepID=UPI001F03E52B
MTYPTVKLGDVAEFIRGITFKPEDVVPLDADDAVVCMRTKNVQTLLDCDDLLAVPSEFVRRKDQYLQEGDILVSSANSWNLVGKCCWVPALPWRAAFGGFISVLRGNHTRVDRRYLYWWFASERVQALLRSFGQKTTNISNLNIDRCLQLELLLPALPEQRRIAAILDKADALRTKRREALAQLDCLAQSIFVEMFGDQRLGVDSHLPRVMLSDLVEVNPRISPDERRLLASTKVTFLPMAAVSDSEKRVINAELRDYEDVAKGYTPFKRGDVLVAKITPCYENGKMALALNLPTEYGFGSTEFHVFRAPSEQLALFTFHLLGQAWVFEAGAKSMKGAAGQRRVPADFFSELRVQRPEQSQLEKFAARVSKIEALKKSLRHGLLDTENLFSSLQHRAFRGEL